MNIIHFYIVSEIIITLVAYFELKYSLLTNKLPYEKKYP